AIPGAGQVFAGWGGVTGVASNPTLSFVMQSNMTLVASFVTNPFPPVKGNYAGLVANTNNVTPNNSGSFTVTVTASGAFTGRSSIGGGAPHFPSPPHLHCPAPLNLSPQP